MEKMLAIHQSRLPQKIKKKKLDKIDLDSQQYMKRVEKECIRIKSGKYRSHQRLPFGFEEHKSTAPSCDIIQARNETEAT